MTTNSVMTPQVTLLDGGMGRELKRIGAPFQQPEWSALALMQAPEYVTQVHQSFIDAGSQVITTSNYAVVPFHIGRDRFELQGSSLSAGAGKLARDVADSTNAKATGTSQKIKVAGSIPPLYGSYRPDLFTPETAVSDYQVILEALHPHVDFWLAETISSLTEFSAVLSALAQLHAKGASSKPLWISFTLQDQWQDGEAVLRSGESIAAAFSAAMNSEVVDIEAILFNCSQPEFISAGIKAAALAQQGHTTKLAIGGYANTFTPRDANAQANGELAVLRDELTPQRYLEIAQDWANDGATIIGGCCGIGPEYIRALQQWQQDI